MKNSIFVLLLLLMVSCSSTQKSDELLIIPVDTKQVSTLPLSEFADKIEAVKLELTDKSLIGRAKDVFCNDKYIVVAELKKIFLFDRGGNFLTQIGSIGNGPGEFTYVNNIYADLDQEKLYVINNSRLICYNLKGEVVMEKKSGLFEGSKSIISEDGDVSIMKEIIGETHHSYILKLDKRLEQVVDSIDIRTVSYDKPAMMMFSFFEDFITINNNQMYVYYPELNPEKLMRDTLYAVDGSRLNPCLQLSFGDIYNADGYKTIYLANIYRSSRFIFATYTREKEKGANQFYFDTKLSKGYCVNGFADDIHQNENVLIRPLTLDGEKFWYMRTVWDGEGDEPNPTLYIGTLKK